MAMHKLPMLRWPAGAKFVKREVRGGVMATHKLPMLCWPAGAKFVKREVGEA